MKFWRYDMDKKDELKSLLDIYNILTTKQITSSMINYIIDMEHKNNVNEIFDKAPYIIDIPDYISLYDVIKPCLMTTNITHGYLN